MTDVADFVNVPSLTTDADPSAGWSLLAPPEGTRDFIASARAHFARLFPMSTLRAMFEGTGAPIDSWSTLVDQGYTVAGLPEDLGGVGSLADLVAVLEEAGHALVPLPLLATAASLQTLLYAGLDLESLDGSPSALAVTSDESAALQVFDGRHAAWLTVVRPATNGVVVQRVTAGGSGQFEADPIDPSRPTVLMERGAVLEERTVLGATLDGILAPARVCVAADLVGTATLALDGAIDHARRREQFGRPIGSFQAVKHLLADSYLAVERARSLTLGAAAELVNGGATDSATRLSMLAKAGAAEAAVHAAAVQTQLLGAMGLTFESDSHLVVRRARQTASFLGTAPDLYARAAVQLLNGGHHD